jgi:hypothetical protein
MQGKGYMKNKVITLRSEDMKVLARYEKSKEGEQA